MSQSDPLITIFTAPKPFTNPHINLIQRNAIQSWQHLGGEVQVLMMGDEAGMEDFAAEAGIQQLTGRLTQRPGYTACQLDLRACTSKQLVSLARLR